jgi:hypothetical protein
MAAHSRHHLRRVQRIEDHTWRFIETERVNMAVSAQIKIAITFDGSNNVGFWISSGGILAHHTRLLAMACLLISTPALAYIGPGAGISFLGSLFSTLMVILLTIGAILFWPLRYLWRRLRRLSRETKNREAKAKQDTN